MMKRLVMLLLAMAALGDLAFTLKCYTCVKKTVGNCSEIVECLTPQTSCQTITKSGDVGFPFHGEETVTKDCAESCKPTEANALGVDEVVRCCQTDLCNKGGFILEPATNATTQKPTNPQVPIN
ncbi:ly6/PLAUR domain-containing protein 2-like [Bufo bufo]|uniref:ly6/PLAUR domain-containing protein 2-like n=1 Tax=Bufo bufo TaxID=8384 RepID=UPI001ABE6952|nr:ly6/PLAUR domain-containing protein 2-like [Bufo bufo]